MDAIAFDRVDPDGPEPDILPVARPDHVDRQNGSKVRAKARGATPVPAAISSQERDLLTEKRMPRPLWKAAS
jgi:hypothetical protein